jgi:hypothetical protein
MMQWHEGQVDGMRALVLNVDRQSVSRLNKRGGEGWGKGVEGGVNLMKSLP